MDEDKGQIFRSPCCVYSEEAKDDDQWTILQGGGDDEDSVVSNNSSYSTDMADDASSSSTTSSSSLHHTEPLYDLSELMAHLPIKRGLSKFYQGKSQSFTSLCRARSIEDLAKKGTPYKRKMKACKSHGCGLDTYKSLSLIKPTISKKVSSRVPFLSSFPSRRGSFLNSCSLPLVPEQKNVGS